MEIIKTTLSAIESVFMSLSVTVSSDKHTKTLAN